MGMAKIPSGQRWRNTGLAFGFILKERYNPWAGEAVQWLGVLTPLAENPDAGLVPVEHQVQGT